MNYYRPHVNELLCAGCGVLGVWPIGVLELDSFVRPALVHILYKPVTDHTLDVSLEGLWQHAPLETSHGVIWTDKQIGLINVQVDSRLLD